MENEKKTSVRIGSFTFGIIMILLGINLFLQTITSVDLFRFTLSLWPLVFILLGTEMLYYQTRKNVIIKYDISAMFIITIVLLLGIVFSLFNYGVNKILYNKGVKSDIIYCLTNNEYNLTFENKIEIKNELKNNVDVKFIQNIEQNNISINIKFNYNDSYDGSVLRLLKDRDLLKRTFNIDYMNEIIIVKDIPEFITNVQIIVTANDISKLKYDGDIF